MFLHTASVQGTYAAGEYADSRCDNQGERCPMIQPRRVLEDVLPARFGGGPTDYQLVERLDNHNGRPVVELHVNPQVNLPDDDRVREVFLEGVGGGKGGEKLMELLWKSATVLSVVRSVPKRTPSGKILHVHQDEILCSSLDDRC